MNAEITPYIEQRILEIVRQTKPRLSNIQREKSISTYDLQLKPVDFYIYDEQKQSLSDEAKQNMRIFSCPNIPLQNEANDESMFIMSLVEAIQKRYCVPFLLTKKTNEGECVITWDNIFIIKNEFEDFYLIVNGFTSDLADDAYGCIRIPFNIRYYPTANSLDDVQELGFLIDDEGLVVMDVEYEYGNAEMNIHIVTNQLNYAEFKFENGTRGFIADLESNGIIFQNNIIIIDGENIVTDNSEYITCIGDNTFIFNNPYNIENLTLRAYYNNQANKSCDNMYHLSDGSIITYLTMSIDNAQPSFIDDISRSLDLDITGNSYQEILEARFTKILAYRKDLLYPTNENTVFNNENVFVVHMDPNEIAKLEDEDTGRTRLQLRRWKGDSDDYEGIYKPVIFVNDQLYKYYHTLQLEDDEFFSFYSRDISYKDKVEIYYFGQTYDTWYRTTYTINVPSDTHTIKTFIDVRNSMIFEKTPEPIEYPEVLDYEHGTLAYEVKFTSYLNPDGSFTIEFEDDSYYDKDLIMVTKNQFLTYHDISQFGENIHIILPDEFKYAHDKDRYMVFINGNRADNKDLEINIPEKDNPFYEISIYSSVIFDNQDEIDVLYLPFAVKDVATIEEIPSNGTVIVDGNCLPFGLNKENYLFFINGRKINNEEIEIVSDNVLQILSDVDSLVNLTISLISINPNQVADLFGTDYWNDIISNLTEEEIASLHNEVNIGNNLPNVLDNETYKRAILIEIYKDYYGLFFEGVPLSYTTTEKDLIIQDYLDANNNYIIDAANARRNDSVDFDHLYPQVEEDDE